MSFKQRFRQVKKLPDWVYWFPCRLLLFLRFVMRHKIDDPNEYITKLGPPAVTVTWHNRLLFFPAMFERKVREQTVAVISASRDGQYIADLVAQFGIRSVRGSTSKKAVQVLHNAMKNAKNGAFVSFTPDGPRGPIYCMSKGPVHMASIMGIPLIPIAVNYSSYWELGSWDRFQIPKPWAKITLAVGDALHVPPDLDAEGLEFWRKKAEDALRAISVDRERRSSKGKTASV